MSELDQRESEIDVKLKLTDEKQKFREAVAVRDLICIALKHIINH